MTATSRPATWKILLAFSAIYLIWGSTYLAIRIGVAEIPPFLMAGLRFTAAGAALFFWTLLQGTPLPTTREWRDASILGALMFLTDYACLFWAEQRVPSGVTAVILAMIPVVIALLEVLVVRTQRLTIRLTAGLVVGILGVGILANPWSSMGEAPLDHKGVVALLVACCGWSVGTIVTRRLTLPASKSMSSGAQMLSGGIQLLLLAAVAGEFRNFHVANVSLRAWFSLVYLIVAGSIICYTAYVWLLHYETPTRVGTYAYVNPVVAVILGALLAGEKVGRRTIVGTILILIGVGAITTARTRSAEAQGQGASRRDLGKAAAD